MPVPTGRGKPAGGLAVALADAVTPGSLWFGWSGKRAPETAAEPTVVEKGGVSYATIDLGEADYQHFYVGFSNGAIWPLLHYRTGLLDYRRDDYEGYLAVNTAYAERLGPLLRPDDLIWVHDYQLLTMAAALRKRGVENRIGFFLHTPFVPPAVLHVLPNAEEIVKAMAAADVIGFHTEGDRRNFLTAAAVILGIAPDECGRFSYGPREVTTVVVPIGIDADRFTKTAIRSVQRAEARRLLESLDGRLLAIGADRLDYTKGLPQRFAAFGQLLDKHPEHRRHISFLQVAARSREDVDRYRTLRRELDRKAGDINGQFSDFDWAPLRYMTRAMSRNTLAGFYRLARIGVVTPLRDGMNLVAKEFVAAQDPEDPGVLVLSRFAGAAEEMTEALIVNPYDPDDTADAMHRALTMKRAERIERHQALLAKVRTNTAAAFCQNFLAYLRGEREPGKAPEVIIGGIPAQPARRKG